MRIALACCTAILASFGACSSAPTNTPTERPSGPERVVRLLVDDRVECDGRTLTFEGFVYELRLACRAAGRDRDHLPWLRVVTPTRQRPGDEELARRVRAAAYDAGVQYIEFEQEGA